MANAFTVDTAGNATGHSLTVDFPILGGNQPIYFVFSFSGMPTAGQYGLIGNPVATVIPANFGALPDSFPGTQVTVGTNPTANPVTFTITDNGNPLGTIQISSGGSVTLSTSGGTPYSLSAGHTLKVAAPGTQDSTLADVAITIAGTR